MTFKSQQHLANRWRLDHNLPFGEHIERWIVWDTQQQVQCELLTLTPSESLIPKQPDFFLNLHKKSTDCLQVAVENGKPYAIYPLPSQEWNSETVLNTEVITGLLHHLTPQLIDINHPIEPTDIVITHKNSSLRLKGHTIKESRFLVDPLHSPHPHQKGLFSLVMMIILNQHQSLQWNTHHDFHLWLKTIDIHTLLPTIGLDIGQWIQQILQGTIVTPLQTSGPHPTIALSPLQIKTSTPTEPPTQIIQSSATKDIPLPKYVLMVAKIPSPSTAKQLAAISNTPPEVFIHFYEQGEMVAIDGADSLIEAQRKKEQYTNVPCTIEIQSVNGILGTSTVTYGLHASLLAGIGLSMFGLGWFPVAIGGIVWASGQWIKGQIRHRHNQQWRRQQQVGVQSTNRFYPATQAARKRILSSELPAVAIQEMMSQLDELEANHANTPQLIIDTANQMFSETSTLSNSVKKSLHDTETIVKKSIE